MKKLVILTFASALVFFAAVSEKLHAQYAEPIWNNPPGEEIPGSEHLVFYSELVSEEVGFNILLPPGYESNTTRYPVVYSLHGRGGNENGLASRSAQKIIEAIEAAAIPPMIVVFINGGAYTFYADSPDGSIPAETMFITELIPHIDMTYRTIAQRSGRAIEGMSMGGLGALILGMKYPEIFGSVVAYAPALMEVQRGSDGVFTLGAAGGRTEGTLPSSPRAVAANRSTFAIMFGGQPELYAKHDPFQVLPNKSAQLRNKLPIRIVIGTVDRLWNANQLFHNLLLQHDYDHDYVQIEGVGHNFRVLFEKVGIEGLGFHVEANNW